MNNNSTTEIRKIFLDYFHFKQHTIIPSSSLIPNDDPSLLFTNAGMNQFKNIILGYDSCHYSRVSTAQRCIRAGGKHNDLENVGFTNRHHTFFEMLGNFSFGNYFKYDAIQYAWELLTSKEWFNLPKNKFLITVYYSDKETYDIWHKDIGISPKNIIYVGDKDNITYNSDNFWQMGDTGPCGPSTEIFYNTNKLDDKNNLNLHKIYNQYYIEIWNIVFIQFNKENNGDLSTLKKTTIDTGMGLERLASVLQGVNSIYEIDIFNNLIDYIMQILKCNTNKHNSIFVIADHIRAIVFLIADGIYPNNENRGYVLRRIIRRAIRHAYMLGMKDIFLYQLVKLVIEIMGKEFNYLREKQTIIENIIINEEKKFSKTLIRGFDLLYNKLSSMTTDTLSGDFIFKLYDTYGFPYDLTVDVCHEHNIKIDKSTYDSNMKQQKNNSKKSNLFKINYNDSLTINDNTSFMGYKKNNHTTVISNIIYNNKNVTTINANEEGILILNQTTFYPESGGQIGDIGEIINNNNHFIVTDTKKNLQSIWHFGKMNIGSLSVNDMVNTHINVEHRRMISANHSATHLLHAALRNILGKHVRQHGSLINSKYLRFDFSHFQALNNTEIEQIENLINKEIRNNNLVKESFINIETAKNQGLVKFSNIKYDQKVRKLKIGDFSTELCCGTHVNRTGEIGSFYIINEKSIASGIRRIEAVTGEAATQYARKHFNILKHTTQLMKTNQNNLLTNIKNTLNKIKVTEKLLKDYKIIQIYQEINYLKKNITKFNEINILISKINNTNTKDIYLIINILKKELKSIIIMLYYIHKDEINIITNVSNNLINKISAHNLMLFVTKQINGKAENYSNFVQGKGYNLIKFFKIIATIKTWIHEHLV
uniref:Alanine--tRNA ligase n=1 Tax=Candidatus Aschnera chinzeii TaxID=1485666 RepID=A0AAT9G519_9ENTR|nr:MAG: alanine--tRNA ligase [Candidatus Aschnera chinzeii]